MGVTELVSTVLNHGQCGSSLAFSAALEATSVSACAIADYWKDCTGGISVLLFVSRRAPFGLFGTMKKRNSINLSVQQYVLCSSGGVNWGILEATPVSVSVIAVVGTTTRPTSIWVLRWSVLSRGDSRPSVRDCRLYDYTAGVVPTVHFLESAESTSLPGQIRG